MDLDQHDLMLLSLFQNDATLTVAALAKEVGLSQNACWRRMKQLEDHGVIRRQVALLDAPAVGCPLTAFVTLQTLDHSPDWSRQLADLAAPLDGVVGLYRTAGHADYVLKIRSADLSAHSDTLAAISRLPGIGRIGTAFVLDEVKETTNIPLRSTLKS